MLRAPHPDPLLEFVIEQLLRVRWISGSSFKEGEGYHLHWSEEGNRRMLLLQLALRESKSSNQGPEKLGENEQLERVIREFWQACVNQLSIDGKSSHLPAFVRAIESWNPKTRDRDS